MSNRLNGTGPRDRHVLRQICGGAVNNLRAAVIVFVYNRLLSFGIFAAYAYS
jgi:hypothetical protein